LRKKAIARHGQPFVARIFTPQEIAYCERGGARAERYAARFAAKEATRKALGTGWARGVRRVDIEVTRLASGQPTIELHGAARQQAERMNVSRLKRFFAATKQPESWSGGQATTARPYERLSFFSRSPAHVVSWDASSVAGYTASKFPRRTIPLTGSASKGRYPWRQAAHSIDSARGDKEMMTEGNKNLVLISRVVREA
jgi:holo-[acyl-carrier protein] synthase